MRLLRILGFLSVSALAVLGACAPQESTTNESAPSATAANTMPNATQPNGDLATAQSSTTQSSTTTPASPTLTATEQSLAAPRRLTAAEKAAMTPTTWRPGCPVPLTDLRVISVRHRTPTGEVATGEIIAHKNLATDFGELFEQLFALDFPIHSVRRMTDFSGDDNASMAANNTSVFNCRDVAGRPGKWSQHAYGRAVDINPVWNPYVPKGKPVQPAAGAAYVDRTMHQPGMIRAGDPVVAAFAAAGFQWGGYWPTMTDYQHFDNRRK